jgi:hypothetical protein
LYRKVDLTGSNFTQRIPTRVLDDIQVPRRSSMAICFAQQSYFGEEVSVAEPRVRPPQKTRRHLMPKSSAEWVAYFQANALNGRGIPWERGAEVTNAERDAICHSLQAWQLGETSDGRHLRAAAARHARRIGDPDYLPAVEYFIREEQRHGELLGRFLDLSGVGRVRKNWGDHLFRAARYLLPNMETWTTPVVMVEVLALIYYNALRRATHSAVLTTICSQILADEIPHIRFQCERLALIYRHRSRPGLWMTMAVQRVFFLVVVLLVWFGHRGALRAGGYGWRHYWRAAWDRMTAAWRAMEPTRYRWN